ncbi:MAG: penicillin-binding transpeptidase domain-containing protein, partial [Thermodesulfobacteriota bacterium]
LEENKPQFSTALTPQTAYIMTSLLQGVVESGTGWRAKALKRPAAGKTGTTNNLNDAWFMGFIPGLVTGTWVGYDEESPLGRYETGSKAAAPIWVKFMKEAIKDRPVENFTMPDGVEFAKIDPKTGLLAGPKTVDPIFEVFKVGTKPTKMSPAKNSSRPNDFLIMDVEESPDKEPAEFFEEDFEDGEEEITEDDTTGFTDEPASTDSAETL